RQPPEKPELVRAEKAEKIQKTSPKPQKLKFSFNEQREYAVIDAELEEIADKIADYDTQIAASANDYVKLQELLAQKEALERLQDEKTERWLYLNELAEQMEAQK
ncbi:MAG: ABC transporter C-terminal domain-containing protein, partial [Butyricicoccus sp.]